MNSFHLGFSFVSESIFVDVLLLLQRPEIPNSIFMPNNRSQTRLSISSLVIEHALSHSFKIILATCAEVHLWLSQLSTFARRNLGINNERAWAIIKFAHFSDIYRLVYLIMMVVSTLFNLLHIQMMRKIVINHVDRWVLLALHDHVPHRTSVLILQHQLHFISLFTRILTCVQIYFAVESYSLRTQWLSIFVHGILFCLQRFASFHVLSLRHLPELCLLQDLVVYGYTTVSLKFIIFVWRINKPLIVHLYRLLRHLFNETADSTFIVFVELFESQHSFDRRLLRRLFLMLLSGKFTLFLIFMVVENRHI